MSRALRGRRAGSGDTRAHIIATARGMFAEHGFDGASLRGIARAAGVDPALIHHYFDSKDELFAACIELPADPAQVLAGVVRCPVPERGEELVRTLLALWESPAQPALLALLRGAVGSRTQAALMREVLGRRIFALITTGMTEEDARLRASLAASQVMGMVMARYVLRLEPLASANREEVVRLVAPTVQRYLDGPL